MNVAFFHRPAISEHRPHTPWSRAAVLILLILSGCEGWYEGWFSDCQLPGLQEDASLETPAGAVSPPEDLRIILDATPSVRGFLVDPRFFKLINNSIRDASRSTSTKTLWAAAVEDGVLSVTRVDFPFEDNESTRALFRRGDTDLAGLVERMDPEQLTVIATDLYQTDQTVSMVSENIIRSVLGLGGAVAVLEYNFDFDGWCYDVGPSRATIRCQGLHPLYLLVMGPQGAVTELAGGLQGYLAPDHFIYLGPQTERLTWRLMQLSPSSSPGMEASVIFDGPIIKGRHELIRLTSLPAEWYADLVYVGPSRSVAVSPQRAIQAHLDSLVYVDSTVTHKAAAASIRVDVLDPSPESDLSMPDNELAVRTQVVDLGALPSCFQVRYSVTEDLTQVPNWVIDLDLPWRNWDRLPPGESFPVHQTQGLRDFIFRLSTSYAEIREPLGVFAIDVHID